MRTQGRLYSTPVVAASSIAAAPPFPGGRGTAKVIDRLRPDGNVVERSPTLPSAAAAAVVVVVNGSGTSIKERLLFDSFY